MASTTTLKHPTRRQFLKTTAAMGTAASLFTISGTKTSGQVIGANDRVRIGVAGIHSRGGAHIGAFAGMKNVEVAYLIDPDSALFASRSKQVKQRGGNTPTCVQDIRKALEDKNLDAVSVATCNHWHALITVWACQAGKDVYVEKPCSHNVFEGRQAVEAARKYKRIVQHGTQSRASDGIAGQIAAVQSGQYGKLLVAKGYCCKPRWSIGYRPHEKPPAELDFNIWTGPAPKQPFHRNLVHYNWHWFWDFGNGDMGNQGVHQMDIARWATGQTLPRSVVSLGGRWVNTTNFRDQGQTPNMELCVFDYGGPLLVFETRGLVGKSKDFPRKVDNEFYCEAGVIRHGKFYPKDSHTSESIKVPDHKKPSGNHFGNFIDCVRSRRSDRLNAEILEGHYSAALCHLGNISYRLGRARLFNRDAPFYADNPQVRDSFQTIRENLHAAGVPLDRTLYQLGPKLDFDPDREKFINSPEANLLLSRHYREPFVVPEKV